MSRTRTIASLAVCICLSWSAQAQADAVTYWNDVSLQAITVGRPGPVGFLDAALVQAGVHDAVQSIERRFEPYHTRVPGASGSLSAAVAGAARGVLLGLYPGQSAFLTERFNNFLTTNPGLDPADPGFAVGQQAAAAILTQYRAAPNPPLPNFTGGSQPGDWRPTPSYIVPQVPAPFSPMAFLYMAFTTPFTLNRPSQFRPAPPPPLRSVRYLRDYNEVKDYGSLTSSARTADQTKLAYFWSENFTAQWNRALRAISEQYVSDIGDNARLFALANLAAADALISCWESKYHFNFWRPVTAIQEGDADDNARTVGDPTWQPLINTPNYPDYTSGANNVTAAMTTVLRMFFGTDSLAFSVTSNSPLLTQPADRTRQFASFSEAADEVVEARILLGIHFRFADEAARDQGTRVAHWAFQRFLRPERGQ